MKRQHYLVVTLAFVIALTVVGCTRSSAASEQTRSTSKAAALLRRFFLSKQTVTGGKAPALCAATGGFHMASITEVWNVSLLQYDVTLGYTAGDSGLGPPAGVKGWIRTGYGANACIVNNTCNCMGYTSDSPQQNGSMVSLVPWANISPDGNLQSQIWQGQPNDNGNLHYGAKCNGQNRVWCIED